VNKATKPIDVDQSESLQAFVEHINEYAIYRTDAEGIIQFWNKGCENLLGWSAAEMIGQHFSCIYRPDDISSGYPDSMLRDAGIKGSLEEKGNRLRKDGTRFPVHMHLYATKNTDGHITGFGAIMRDYTAKAETETRLLASESRLQSLIETIVDGVITINERGIIDSCNNACIKLFGYETHEIIGRNINMLMPEPYQSAHDGYIANYHKSGNAKVIGIGREVTGKRKDGTTFPMELAVGETHAGEEYAFVGIIRDITERQEAEKAKEQLRQSQRMEALGQLTGGIAHDFNNLLAIILGNLDFMEERLPKDSDLLEFVKPSIAAAEHGSELTHQLLAFGRQQALQPQILEINALLLYFTTFIRHMLGVRINTSLVCCKNTWDIYVDPNQLQNALINLSINARDAMPDGGNLVFETANVTFDAAETEDNLDLQPGDYVMIAISDTGIGMDANTIAKAFEPFFTTKPVGKGTGLGLSMAYGFAKQSHGNIKIYSEPGFGTSIKLYLPRNISGGEVMSQQPQELCPLPNPLNKLILVVEDNEAVLKVTASMLESIGYRTITATTGDEALHIITQRSDIDLLLSDVMLPGSINGPTLGDQALLIRPQLKVLFNSGYAEQALQNRGTLDKNVNLISKPFRKMQLASKIAEILGY